ncbi:N-acetylmuramoyl-L-alanine amidase [uncultured Thiodictyon sp.]|uniref:N-acetylmuramoyl-L-alanine amidase n=1 Tax=uncultured Thiodictyon sp. TaxID=1846217 RepID=UPI0025DC8146|nr:N-acetylmuramoyl-L-alanine amidase [uncultured Thiodictyon sp.]
MGNFTGPDTDHWPVVEARWYKKITNKSRVVHRVVIHTMEAPETANTAENVAKYFQGLPKNRQASAHLCIDNNSIVQCVLDNHVAYAAPGANSDGIQLELAGYAAQGAADWSDNYSTALLENAANAAAQYCLKYDLPRKHLTNTELEKGHEGIIGHDQATAVFKLGSHTDPGKHFPWDHFIKRVEFYYAERKKQLGLS